MKLPVKWYEYAEGHGSVEGAVGRKLPFLWYWYVFEMYRDPDGVYDASGEEMTGHTLTRKAAFRRMEQGLIDMDELIENREVRYDDA